MFFLAFLLVLAAAGLLIGGLSQGSQGLIWGSIGASIAAALTLILLVSVRRRRAAAAGPTSQITTVKASPRSARAVADNDVPVASGTSGTDPPVDPPVGALAARIAELESELRRSGAADVGPVSADQIDADLAEIERLESAADATAPVEPDQDRTVAGVPTVDEDEEDPAEEDASMTDSVLVVDLDEEIFVVDGRPRYHLFLCSFLSGRDPIALSIREAREDGFTPCSRCTPDAVTATATRSRRARRTAAGSP